MSKYLYLLSTYIIHIVRAWYACLVNVVYYKLEGGCLRKN